MNCSSLYWPSCLSSWVPPWVSRALTVEHTLVTVFPKRLLMRISVNIAMSWRHCKSFCCDMVILLVLASKSTTLTRSYFRTGLSIFCLVLKSASKMRCSQGPTHAPPFQHHPSYMVSRVRIRPFTYFHYADDFHRIITTASHAALMVTQQINNWCNQTFSN